MKKALLTIVLSFFTTIITAQEAQAGRFTKHQNCTYEQSEEMTLVQSCSLQCSIAGVTLGMCRNYFAGEIRIRGSALGGVSFDLPVRESSNSATIIRSCVNSSTSVFLREVLTERICSSGSSNF